MAKKASKKKLWRCWRSLGEMEEWKLTALLFISSLSLWGLCTLLLPCVPALVTILGLGIFMTWCPKGEAKETSAGKSCWRSKREDPIGAAVPWEGVEGSTQSLKAGWGKPHGGGRWGSNSSGEAASASELPGETGGTGRAGNFSAGTSSGLLRNQPSVTNVEELARSLMESLDVSPICLDLLGKLKEAQASGTLSQCGAIRKEYPVCLQCPRCLTGSCPHRSQPAAEQHLPVLAAILRTADILVHEEDVQLEMGLGFELAIGGEPLYVWERAQRLPEMAPERCCQICKAPLPRSCGASESSQALLPTVRAWGAPEGEKRPARQDARAPPARQTRTDRDDTSSADLQPEGQEESVPTAVPTTDPTQPRPSGQEPPSPTILDRLRRAGTEPLPRVGYKAAGWKVALQRIRQSWSRLKSGVRRSIGDDWDWLWAGESSEPEDTVERDETLPFSLRLRGNALFHTTAMEA